MMIYNSTIQNLTFNSRLLNKEMAVQIYLPSKLPSSCSVLYFLHGRSGDENFLRDIGLQQTMDRLIDKELIEPMVVVAPRMDNSRGINSSIEVEVAKDSRGVEVNRGRYEDYFISEVIPLVENKFFDQCLMKDRYVGGASAGGYAALHYAFRHPSLFSKVGGHMPALDLSFDLEDLCYFDDLETWEKYDPITIAQTSILNMDVKVYLDAGDQDEGGFYDGCKVLANVLLSHGVEVQNHIFDGHHNLAYIQCNLEKYMLFYSGKS